MTGRTLKFTLSPEDHTELLTACQECAADPQTGEAIQPKDFALQCVQIVLADRRLARIKAEKEVREEVELREISREINNKIDQLTRQSFLDTAAQTGAIA